MGAEVAGECNSPATSGDSKGSEFYLECMLKTKTDKFKECLFSVADASINFHRSDTDETPFHQQSLDGCHLRKGESI